jgi:tetraacyldisaccharide 4'-kinase
MKHKNLTSFFVLGRPFSPVYSAFMKCRAWAYNKGYLATKRLPCSVISVGNLSLGGTGKTPHVLIIANWLKNKGIRTAVLSRGYGGRAKCNPLIVSDGTNVLASPVDAGDEPVMLSKTLSKIPVIVGSDRYKSGKLAIERFNTQAIVLDDGFQHMSLFRDIDLVLLPTVNFFGTRWVFPGGDLREPISALYRATAILLTRAEELSSADQKISKQEIQRIIKGKPVFLSEMRTTKIISTEGEIKTTEMLAGKPMLAFCALGNPESFFTSLENLGVDLRSKIAFPDHYPYKNTDLSKLISLAKKRGAKSLVTTQKDWAKIESIWHNFSASNKKLPSLWILKAEAMPEEGFWKMLEVSLNATHHYCPPMNMN